jgi:hypothetical protein
VSRQCITQSHNTAIAKIRDVLSESPELRDWLIDNNYIIPETGGKGNGKRDTKT